MLRAHNKTILSSHINAYFDDARTAAATGRRDTMLAMSDTLEDRAARIPDAASLFAPVFGKLIASHFQSMAEMAATRTMLALEVHAARHHGFPESLDQIDKDLLAEVPIDPFSGKPLCYRRIDPASDELHRPYLLYSTGADGHDDGGVTAKEPYKAFSRGAGGVDFVYNRLDN